MLPGTKDQAEACNTAAKLLQALAQPYTLEHQALDIAASIGIALYPEHGLDATPLLRRADVAMYVAKRGSGGFAMYEFKHDEQSLGQFVLVSELREAIENSQLVLHFMPEVDVKAGEVVRVEALVRWQHPKFGLMPPDRFVPMAEQTGLIRPLALWVLEAAVRQQEAWRKAGLELTVSVNLSTRNLHDPQLPDAVARLIATYGVPRGGLKVEITESSLMADPDRALEILTQLKAMGILIAIDDFGTGYSSLSYLKRLRVDEIKIDKSFVFDMTSENSDAAIVRRPSIWATVVAEGVESKDALDKLTDDVCDYAQGYYVSDAGSWGTLDRLATVAPVLGVRGGHNGPGDTRIVGEKRVVDIDGLRAGVVHDLVKQGVTAESYPALKPAGPDLAGALTTFFGERLDLLLYARTHVPRVGWSGGVFLVNPGSPTLPVDRPKGSLGAVAVVECEGGVARPRIIELWR